MILRNILNSKCIKSIVQDINQQDLPGKNFTGFSYYFYYFICHDKFQLYREEHQIIQLGWFRIFIISFSVSRIKTSVSSSSFIVKYRNYPFIFIDCSMNHWFSQDNTCIVYNISGFKIICGINNYIIFFKDLQRIGFVAPEIVDFNFYK